MLSNSQSIKDYDPDLWKALDGEITRQEDHIELIASENYASKRVLEAQGSVLTNKYAEGYPGRRYYGGCEFVDVAETLAIERGKALFGCSFVNVQPHSGAQASARASNREPCPRWRPAAATISPLSESFFSSPKRAPTSSVWAS